MSGVRHYSRRSLLERSAIIAGAGVLASCGKSGGSVCFDEAYLSAGEAQMRKTLAYVDQFSLPESSCSQCQFYRAAETAGCGECELLAGPVSASGHCNSWAARA